ncbi:helix-turn-helix transcriptional regulator [uncultured Ruminococcus sp.]|uniref:helix-turn-helix domain-containing protein n=1 Tax=uncultured Ruminococcus sp. TaxID=165186 RepID=UPI0025EFC26A|nr:helix-turn-helix transcriptional regulator [uncultured Ruminococcus sp.]
MLFGEKVKQLRKEKGLTQTELAEAVGVTLRTVQNYEGKNLFPKNQDVVNKLCKVLDTTPDYLISDDDVFINEAHDKGGTKGRQNAERIIKEVSALFSGGDLSDADRDNVMKCIQEAYWESKEQNKKYAPKKFRKDDE